MTKDCPICGKKFITYTSLIKKGWGKFCSKQCFYSYNVGENCGAWKPKTETTCQTCGKKFLVIPSRAARGNVKFCSHKCFGEWRSENSKGANNHSWKGGEVLVECRACGESFLVGKHRVKRGVSFCSKRCQVEWQKTNMGGAQSPRWKGGLTPVNHVIRESNKYDSWRLGVFTRDKYKCQSCGIKGGVLRAHHIKPFAKIIREVKEGFPLFDLVSGAMAYRPLWDITNGITLCESCHKKEHKKVVV